MTKDKFSCYMYFCLLSQVKAIEKHDSVLTSSQQIDRLLRPGSTYFNLNPFDVSVAIDQLILVKGCIGFI